MKPQFNKTWLIIAVIIIGNIIVFSFLSKKLEGFVLVSMESQNLEDLDKMLK